MKTRALICDANQQFTLSDVILSDPSANDIVVRTLYSGVSVGTELALVRGKVDWGPYPLCTGYQAVGVVEKVGTQVRGFKAGDKVYYRSNCSGSVGMSLTDGESVSCVSGTHCGYAIIDPTQNGGIDHLPDGVGLEPASMFVMPAVGLHGVDMANPSTADTVVVYGTGLIGMGVVAACAVRGCVVIAVDIDDKRLSIARQLGADYTFNSTKQDVLEEVKKVSEAMAQIVFESTGIPECLEPAIALCMTHGKFVWQGNYGAKPIPFHFLSSHGRQLTTYFPCDDGLEPCRRAVLKNMANGVLPWEKTISHCIKAEQSPEFLDRINKNDMPELMGGVIQWSD